jgi:hypothetical protein
MANRKNSFVLLLGLAIFLAGAAFAHEGGKHFLGSVKSFDAGSLTIITTTNETVTLKLLPTTKFFKDNQPASLQDLKTGERVVVHAKQNGTAWETEEVRLGTSSPKATK